jgi:hypothetical protein
MRTTAGYWERFRIRALTKKMLGSETNRRSETSLKAISGTGKSIVDLAGCGNGVLAAKLAFSIGPGL